MVFRNVPKLHGLAGCGILIAIAAVPIGCGDDQFSGCEASRTCPPARGGGGGEGGEGGAGDNGGTGGTTVAGGMGGAGECTRDADCDDDDATNGAESCVEGGCEPGNPPPAVESVTPVDGEDDIDVDATISIEFSERLDSDTVSSDSIRVTVNGTAIAGEVSYDDETTVTFSPSERFYLGGSHTVTVTTDVTDAAGAALLEPFESAFTVRDGTWGALGALPDTASVTMPVVTAVGAGDLLVAWSSATGLVTRWFHSTGGWGDVEPLSDCLDCTSLALAGNRAGEAIAAFVSGTRVLARQYRDGEWEALAREVVDVSEANPSFSVAMSPSGEAHVLVAKKEGANAGVLLIRGTNTTGGWTDMDETGPGIAGAPPQLAFDANGDGLAVWSASTTNEMVVRFSRYDRSSRTWSSAEPIGSSAMPFVGAPAIAFGEAGSAMAVWRSTGASSNDSRLVASGYADEQFEDPMPINSGTNEGMPAFPPKVAFDGSDFVVAWTETRAGGVSRVYTNRLTGGEWQGAEPRDTQSAGTSFYWMPYLGVDAVGNLQLLWRSATTEMNWDEIVSSRYSRGAAAWSDADRLFSTPIHLDDREVSLAVAPNGVSAALYRYQLQDLSGTRSSIAVFE